MVESVLIRK